MFMRGQYQRLLKSGVQNLATRVLFQVCALRIIRCGLRSAGAERKQQQQQQQYSFQQQQQQQQQ